MTSSSLREYICSVHCFVGHTCMHSGEWLGVSFSFTSKSRLTDDFNIACAGCLGFKLCILASFQLCGVYSLFCLPICAGSKKKNETYYFNAYWKRNASTFSHTKGLLSLSLTPKMHKPYPTSQEYLSSLLCSSRIISFLCFLTNIQV